MELNRREISALAAVNPDEFYVEKLLIMWSWEKTQRNGDFECVSKDMNWRRTLGSNGLRFRISSLWTSIVRRNTLRCQFGLIIILFLIDLRPGKVQFSVSEV